MTTAAATDPGPLARFKAVIEDANTLAIVVQRLTDGETLKEIAAAWQIPYGRLAQWIIEDRERSSRYNAALAIWADSIAQECVSIADGGVEGESHHRDKLRIDTRLKLAGKWDRGRYGDHVGHNVTVKDERAPLEREQQLLEAARAIGFVLATGEQIKRERELNPLLPAPEAVQQNAENASGADESQLI